MPPQDNRAERQLIRTRDQLMEDRRWVQGRLQSLLSFLGITCPEHTVWTQEFLRKLEAIKRIKELARSEVYKPAVTLLGSAP